MGQHIKVIFLAMFSDLQRILKNNDEHSKIHLLIILLCTSLQNGELAVINELAELPWKSWVVRRRCCGEYKEHILQGGWLWDKPINISTALWVYKGFSRGRVSLCLRGNPGQFWSTSHEVTHCYVPTHQPSSKLEPVSAGLVQLCHVQICAGLCPEAVASSGGALAGLCWETHSPPAEWNLFLFCHLLLSFTWNSSKDSWKWAPPSEVDFLPHRDTLWRLA